MNDEEYYKKIREIREELAKLKEEFNEFVSSKTSWDIKSLNGDDLEKRYEKRKN